MKESRHKQNTQHNRSTMFTQNLSALGKYHLWIPVFNLRKPELFLIKRYINYILHLSTPFIVFQSLSIKVNLM